MSGIISQYFLTPVQRILALLNVGHPVGHPPTMMWIFDEAANLDMPDELAAPNFTALRRVLLIFSKYPIWSLFLSTNSMVRRFAAGSAVEKSDRVFNRELRLFPPFFGLPMDVELKRRLEDDSVREGELRRPMVEFASVEHMTLFGRPLWRAYADQPVNKVREFVQHKLLCGYLGEPSTRPVHQVFALLASRLTLDLVMNHPEAASLAREAVNSHLRLMTGWDSLTGATSTTTPSEPIVADAAAGVLLATSQAGVLNWVQCTNILANELLARGLVGKGLRGELYARFILVLACDIVRQPNNEPAGNYFPNSRPFRLATFLEVLLGTAQFTAITGHRFQKPFHTLRNRNATHGSIEPQLLRSFAGAYLNFTHFASTREALPPDTARVSMLLGNMIRRHQGLQLAELQPDWDLIIPLYLGPIDAAFSTSYVSAILIQVKNRKTKSRLSCKPYHIKSIFGNNQPKLQILLDLGVQSEEDYQFEQDLESNTYSIHIRGSGSSTFSCLSLPGMESASRLLIGEPTNSRWASIHDDIVAENRGVQMPK